MSPNGFQESAQQQVIWSPTNREAHFAPRTLSPVLAFAGLKSCICVLNHIFNRTACPDGAV